MRAYVLGLLAWVALTGVLAACTASGAHGPTAQAARAAPPAVAQRPAPPPAPRPAEGLWAILDPGCGKPHFADPRRWPKCAQPFWISRGQAVVVRSRSTVGKVATETSYRAPYLLAGEDPLIAQVGNPKDGFLYLALTKLDRDDKGRLVAAMGTAFACDAGRSAALAAALNRGGCEGLSPEVLRQAAQQTLKEFTALTAVAWIAPGAPVIAAKGAD